MDTPAAFTRNQRRTAARRGRPVPPVRVIQLRREGVSDANHDESNVEWNHRWVVRGHWRNQWYPAVQDHRPVWIEPYLKGPKDKPLIGGEKVHKL